MPIPDTTKLERLEENIGAVAVELTSDDLREIESAASEITEQLPGHLNRARENGLSETELVEVITHLAFYSGWPKSMSAIRFAKEVFKK